MSETKIPTQTMCFENQYKKTHYDVLEQMTKLDFFFFFTVAAQSSVLLNVHDFQRLCELSEAREAQKFKDYQN